MWVSTGAPQSTGRDERTASSEERIDVDLRRPSHFVPPVEIMARAAGKQMVEDMLAMLDPEDQIEILKAAEENLRKM
ncbi:MAG TPA: hypothetical protein ENF26_05665 [Methanomicrobia archaeon]|nr:hypothetical protein [Methanomicrobia archaeon]HEX59615.1 hypothetical protein [Methanomicrobia archaeon]